LSIFKTEAMQGYVFEKVSTIPQYIEQNLNFFKSV
jgi:hypothetical protein